MQPTPAISAPDDSPADTEVDASPSDPQFQNERCWEKAGAMRRKQPMPIAAPPASLGPHAPIAEPRFIVDWVDQQHESEHAPDPAYPNGTAVDVALDAMKACRLELPCPTARCGLWVITCRTCGYAITLATAGRADDPRSVRMPCKLH